MKNSKAPLERKRPLLFATGLMFTLSVTLVSFEWRTPYKVPYVPPTGDGGEIETIFIPVTLPEPRKNWTSQNCPSLKS